MVLRRSFLLVLLLSPGWMTEPALGDGAEEAPRLYPGIRFARSAENEVIAEYLGRSSDDFPVSWRQLPAGRGSMRVDCQRYGRVGFTFDPVGVGNAIYGANTKYRSEWTHSAFPDQSVERMQYRRNRSGYMTTGITLRDWSVNGTIRLVIRVEGSVEYQTEFELENCLANMYRTPTPPSEMIRQYGDGETEEEGSER